jgi:hypothetical protein
MSMFQMAGNADCAKAPTFFIQMRVQKKALFDKGSTGMLQGFFFGLYAFFFNMEKFNKAIAMTLFAIVGRVAKVPNSFKQGIKRVQTLCACLTVSVTQCVSWQQVQVARA